MILLQHNNSPCLWGLEYADCIPLQRGKTFSLKKKCVLDIALNCIRWWGSSFGDQEEYRVTLS